MLTVVPARVLMPDWANIFFVVVVYDCFFMQTHGHVIVELPNFLYDRYQCSFMFSTQLYEIKVL